MKQFILLFLLLIPGFLLAQEDSEEAKFYIGVSYGTSFSLGDFSDTDIENPDAGFAKNGQKLDLYGGYFLDNRLTLTFTFRYQTYDTEVEDVIDDFNEANPGAQFSGSTEDWQAYYFLVGLDYRFKLTRKLSISPRFGLGPLFVTSPGLTVSNPDGTVTTNFSRSSETGAGLGYEFGFGLRNDFGKRISLMPTFTFSGGFVNIPDVVTTTDNAVVISDYTPPILSFNIGLSLAYRFY